MPEPQIIVYGRPGCGPCEALHEWLDSLGVEHKTVGCGSPEFPEDITRVPTFAIRGERVQGFNRMAILELLKKYGYQQIR